MMYNLADGKFLNMDMVAQKSIREAFTFLSYQVQMKNINKTNNKSDDV